MRRLIDFFLGPRDSGLEPGCLKKVRDMESRVGYRFRDIHIAAGALAHRSYLNTVSEELVCPFDSNERLEFLGDSVLELVVNDFLYHRFPDEQEGDLTKMKSLLVSRSVLADQARNIDLGSVLFLSDAERDSGGSDRSSILADGFEAVVGAVYLDGGLTKASEIIHRLLLNDVADILDSSDHFNYKSLLQEKIQDQEKTYPRYHVVSEAGPDHKKTFTVEVRVRGDVLGVGRGTNKKRAEQAAAQHALRERGLLDSPGD